MEEHQSLSMDSVQKTKRINKAYFGKFQEVIDVLNAGQVNVDFCLRQDDQSYQDAMKGILQPATKMYSAENGSGISRYNIEDFF